MAWNEERTDLCVKLWRDGVPASTIADRLGGVSRNAVIGRMHRLGITTGRANAQRLGGRITKAKRRRKRKASESLRFGKAESFEPVAIEPLPPEPPKPDKLFSLTEITDREERDHVKLCRFIYGDPQTKDSGYCGCEASIGSSYCAWHRHVCTAAPQPRKRKPAGSFKTYVKNHGHPGHTRKLEVVF